MGGLAAFGAVRATNRPLEEDATDVEASAREEDEMDAAALPPVQLLSVELGLDLIPFAEAKRGGELTSRIAALRKQMARELGVLVPPVHVRDELRLPPSHYRILVSGVKVAEAELRTHQFLVIDAEGRALAQLPGKEIKEPTFGLPAKWVSASDRARAEACGATVVAPSAVLATHLSEVIRRHAHELLGRREVQQIIDEAAKQDSQLVEELVPQTLSLAAVVGVLRNLLRESVSIRDIRTILEALADHGGEQKDPGALTELVRQRLSRWISAHHLGDGGE